MYAFLHLQKSAICSKPNLTSLLFTYICVHILRQTLPLSALSSQRITITTYTIVYICGTYVSWKVARQLQKFHWHARRRFINGRVVTKLFYLSTENNDKIDRIFVHVINRGKWTKQHVLLTRGDRVRVQGWGRGTSIG